MFKYEPVSHTKDLSLWRMETTPYLLWRKLIMGTSSQLDNLLCSMRAGPGLLEGPWATSAHSRLRTHVWSSGLRPSAGQRPCAVGLLPSSLPSANWSPIPSPGAFCSQPHQAAFLLRTAAHTLRSAYDFWSRQSFHCLREAFLGTGWLRSHTVPQNPQVSLTALISILT